MFYSIGDVSKILNVSKEMIRYYEKQGALKPARKENNNYRSYSTMDIFFLMEMIRYQALGLTTTEINQLLNNNYMQSYSDCLSNYHKKLEKEITFKLVLKDRIKEMADRAKTSQLNINHYWFKNVDEHEYVFLCKGKDDCYGEIELTKENRNIMFAGQNFTFFESMVIFNEEDENWVYAINTNYKETLNIEMSDAIKQKSQLCICTMIDMSEVGCFNRKLLEPILKYIEEHQMTIVDKIRGIIICRGYQNNKYQRIIEIQIPIKP